MQVKQTDSNKHTRGSACFKLSLLRPSNPEDFPLGKSLTIFETSFIVTCIPTLESTLMPKLSKTVNLDDSLELSFSNCL